MEINLNTQTKSLETRKSNFNVYLGLAVTACLWEPRSQYNCTSGWASQLGFCLPLPKV